MSDSGHGGNQREHINRYHDVCKPAFDRIRHDFSQVDERFNLMEHRMDFIREGLGDIKGQLNNGIHDKIKNTNDIIEGLQGKLDKMVFWVLAAAGTIILSAIGVVVTAAVGIIGG